MFSVLAWVRVFAFTSLFFSPSAFSREEKLFTSSVTYCEPPETLLIQRFDVVYFAKNQSIFFNISAASVEPNVNITANLFLNVYGMNPVNITIDLCSILDGALCPLPMYNFTGEDSLPLPSKADVASQIPSIAYKIPDLEAFAQLTLVEVGTGDVKACVQATLSNGWSTHQRGVEWATGALAIFAFVSALWQSLDPTAIAPFRLVDLFYLYQSIAITGFLSVNYPSLYRGFVLNFAWAMGLFSSSSSSFQRSIDNMRALTGGSMANATDGSAVGLVNRKLSPYNVLSSSRIVLPSQPQSFISKQDLTSNSSNSFSNFLSTQQANIDSINQLSASPEVVTVTQASSNVLQAGLPIYVNSIHIATANTFMTVFLVSFILVAIVLVIFGLGYVVLLFLGRLRLVSEHRRQALRTVYPPFVRAWSLRLAIVIYTPIIIFVLYQWTLKDSWLSVLLAVIAFFAMLGFVGYHSFLVLRFARRDSPGALYSHKVFFASYGPLIGQYRPSRYYFFLLLPMASFLKAIIVAAVRGHGQTQIILLLILEFSFVMAHIILRPYPSKGGDILSTYLAITRFVCTGLMITFIERLTVMAIPRVVVGAVIGVIFSVSIVVMFVNVIIHCGISRLWRRSHHPSSVLPGHNSSKESMLEKGDCPPANRPFNPTPERNIPLDPLINQPYPDISPTETPVIVTSQPSMSTRESGSTTLGSILPRRWSFSQPGSPPVVSTPHSASSTASSSPPSSDVAHRS